ncbi:MAG: Gfo/Idh/MocA family protein, partial [Pirellulaceae bacterium]
AAPCIISATALGSGRRAAASDRITTALIGSGGRGQQIMAGGDQIVAVCDVDNSHCQRAKEKIDALSGHRGCTPYRDFRDVLLREDIDAVVVATPDHWHALIAIAAMKAGKAVYVEKPMTFAIDEGRVMAEVARRYGTVVQVGSQQRSDEKFIRACELVRNGRIGDLKSVFVGIETRPGKNAEPWTPAPVPDALDYDLWLGPAPWAPYHKDRCHYNFRFVSDYSGGDVTNWGAHHLDITQWALNADDSGPERIQGTGRRNPSGLHDVFYDVHVDFTYANGVTVKLRTERFEGTGGIRFEGTEGWIYVSRSKIDAEPKSILTSRIGPNEVHLTLPGGQATHMGLWLDCVRSRNAKGVNVPVEVGHRSATLCHLANMAMELKRELKWDPAREEFIDDDIANRMKSRTPRGRWKL